MVGSSSQTDDFPYFPESVIWFMGSMAMVYDTVVVVGYMLVAADSSEVVGGWNCFDYFGKYCTLNYT